MPELFELRIRQMRICAVTELVCILMGLPVIGLLALALTAEVSLGAAAALAVAALICVVCFACCRVFIGKRRVHGTHCEIPVGIGTYEELTAAMSGTAMRENAYIAFMEQNGMKIRVLMQYAPVFNQQAFSKQRKSVNAEANKQFRISSSVSIYEAFKRLRINLVVCGEADDALLAWVNRDAYPLLHRNEAVVNAAVALGTGKLLFPVCVDHLTLLELKRYEAAARLLAEKLRRTHL